MYYIFKFIKKIFSAVCNALSALIPYEKEDTVANAVPFVLSEYFDRMEKTNLEILEQRVQVKQVIILWWGLDGLQLSENGTLKWISRKKQPIVSNVYQPWQTGNLMAQLDACQPMETRIDILRLQAAQAMQNATAVSMLQCYASPYSPYVYGGNIELGRRFYAPQLTNSCCNWRIL